MDSTAIVHMGFILFTGFIITLFYLLIPNFLQGIGGRPGTIAFLSNLTTLTLEYLINLTKIYQFDIPKFLFQIDQYKILNNYIFVIAPILTAISSFLVHYIADVRDDILKITHRIFAYGIVTLLGTQIILCFSDFNNFTSGSINISYAAYFANFWHIGTLCGLSIKSRFYFNYIKGYCFYHYLIVGYFAGWLGIGLCGIVVIGGKHGFVAFLAGNIYIWSLKLIYYLFDNDENINNIETDKKNIEEKKVETEMNALNENKNLKILSTSTDNCKKNDILKNFENSEYDQLDKNKINTDRLNSTI
jgi:hypothetical protein